MSSILSIQDPSYDNSYMLHEALVKAATKAKYGAGTYAFASGEGVNILLDDEVFAKLCNKGHFRIIIGIDETTSTATLEVLKKFEARYSTNIQIQVFLHSQNVLYHPKFSWFNNGNGGYLVIGSGNLTKAGLRNNYEAFSIISVNKKDINEIEKDWNDWIHHNLHLLKKIDDPEVIKKAAENAKQNRRLKAKNAKSKAIVDASEIIKDEEISEWLFSENCRILVEEVTRSMSGQRKIQINFRKQPFQEFFGAQPGVNKSYRAIFKGVIDSTSLAEIEHRYATSSSSKNWRFDFAILKNRPISKDKLIGIFVQLSPRTYMYSILYPSDKGYKNLSAALSKNRVIHDRFSAFWYTTPSELKKYASELDILSYIV